MEIEKLIIIGKSDATITMILDNLESNNSFPDIFIVNNMGLEVKDKIQNNKFNLSLVESIEFNSPMIIGVFTPKWKKKLIESFNFDNFLNVIHSSSQISSTAKMGHGCMINSLVSIAAHTTIGNFVSINRNASIGHHTILKDFVTVNPGCNIAGHVEIGDGTTIGMGSNIIEKIKIGKNTIVGAGSVVTKDLPDNVIAYGNPCKIIKKNNHD